MNLWFRSLEFFCSFLFCINTTVPGPAACQPRNNNNHNIQHERQNCWQHWIFEDKWRQVLVLNSHTNWQGNGMNVCGRRKPFRLNKRLYCLLYFYIRIYCALSVERYLPTTLQRWSLSEWGQYNVVHRNIVQRHYYLGLSAIFIFLFSEKLNGRFYANWCSIDYVLVNREMLKRWLTAPSMGPDQGAGKIKNSVANIKF